MKKLSVLLLAFVLVVALSTATMASTMGVNVNEGYSVTLEKSDAADDITITGNFGVSDELLLMLGYTTESEIISLSARYELMENVALTAGYDFSDYDNAWAIGVRGKLGMTDELALTGKFEYSNYSSDFGLFDNTAITLFGQAEYAFTEKFVATLGVGYTKADFDVFGEDSLTNYVLGFEFYPTETIVAWVDYETYNNDNDATIYFGIDFAF